MNRFTAHEHLFIQFYCLSDPTIVNVYDVSPCGTDREKEREKDKNAYTLKSRNVPGAADIPDKEDSPGFDVGTKSARTDLRRASVSGDTQY